MTNNAIASQSNSNYWLLTDPKLISSTIKIVDIDGITISATNLNSIHEINLRELIDSKFELLKPIQVKISHQELDYIGEIPELNIYAFGDSYWEVLREINKDVTELFEELSGYNEDQLGKEPAKWKEFLSNYIKRNSD